MTQAEAPVLIDVCSRVGYLTLNRPAGLNAVTLEMVRMLHRQLQAWADDQNVVAVVLRAAGEKAFCAGGDIRSLYDSYQNGDSLHREFFEEEYALDQYIHAYTKPLLALMNGFVLGGGMGLVQGAALRVVTERTKMGMPETAIGLFPDVGGGYFLSRCPGHTGEWLALTGDTIGADLAVALGLADGRIALQDQAPLWDALAEQAFADSAAVQAFVSSKIEANNVDPVSARAKIDQYFSLPTVGAMIAALEAAEGEWERQAAATLRKRSPLMLCVVLEQIRRARGMDLATDLRMERDMVRHAFHLRPGQSETLEGIRALAVDKDHAPRWNPARIEDVSPDMVAPFFASPWPVWAHPLAALA